MMMMAVMMMMAKRPVRTRGEHQPNHRFGRT
jgi:hypothetical protein